MHYRKEIDGLRAIAIIPVLWIHAGFPYLTGGFIGVDVFFVISGFLITSILLKELENKNFSIGNFYERRARRILPALITVIIFTSIVAPFISSHPKFLEDYGTSVISTMLFASNIFFWQTSGYFGSVSELSPMLHTWSLAVEEQFYIFFPILLALTYPYGKKVLIGALIAVSLSSLFIAEWGASNYSVANFYLLPSRAWELFAGALAAMLIRSDKIKVLRNGYSTLLSLIGLTQIFSSYFLFSPSTSHPSLFTLAPITGTVFVLLFSTEQGPIGKFLSSKIMAFIGVMSYGLYLWHQPILALMKRKYSLHLSLGEAIFSIIVTFLLSYLTWKFVETPLRNRKKYSVPFTVKLSVFSAVVVLLVGLLFNQNMHFQKIIYPKEMARFEQLLEADDSHTSQVMYDDNKCKFWSSEFTKRFYSRFNKCSNQYGEALFIIGGSHGMDLYNAIAMTTDYPFVVSISKGFCRAHSFISDVGTTPKCQYEEFKQFSKFNSSNISLVIYTQTVDRLFNVNPMSTASTEDININSVNEVVEYLSDLKITNDLNVIMLGMLPVLEFHPIDWNYREPFYKQYDAIISPKVISLTRHVDREFARKLRPKGVPYYSKSEAFSLNFEKDLIHQGKITYSDKRHLSLAGERLFGERLVNFLNHNGYSFLTTKDSRFNANR